MIASIGQYICLISDSRITKGRGKNARNGAAELRQFYQQNAGGAGINSSVRDSGVNLASIFMSWSDT